MKIFLVFLFFCGFFANVYSARDANLGNANTLTTIASRNNPQPTTSSSQSEGLIIDVPANPVVLRPVLVARPTSESLQEKDRQERLNKRLAILKTEEYQKAVDKLNLNHVIKLKIEEAVRTLNFDMAIKELRSVEATLSKDAKSSPYFKNFKTAIIRFLFLYSDDPELSAEDNARKYFSISDPSLETIGKKHKEKLEMLRNYASLFKDEERDKIFKNIQERYALLLAESKKARPLVPLKFQGSFEMNRRDILRQWGMGSNSSDVEIQEKYKSLYDAITKKYYPEIKGYDDALANLWSLSKEDRDIKTILRERAINRRQEEYDALQKGLNIALQIQPEAKRTSEQALGNESVVAQKQDLRRPGLSKEDQILIKWFEKDIESGKKDEFSNEEINNKYIQSRQNLISNQKLEKNEYEDALQLLENEYEILLQAIKDRNPRNANIVRLVTSRNNPQPTTSFSQSEGLTVDEHGNPVQSSQWSSRATAGGFDLDDEGESRTISVGQSEGLTIDVPANPVHSSQWSSGATAGGFDLDDEGEFLGTTVSVSQSASVMPDKRLEVKKISPEKRIIDSLEKNEKFNNAMMALDLMSDKDKQTLLHNLKTNDLEERFMASRFVKDEEYKKTIAEHYQYLKKLVEELGVIRMLTREHEPSLSAEENALSYFNFPFNSNFTHEQLFEAYDKKRALLNANNLLSLDERIALLKRLQDEYRILESKTVKEAKNIKPELNEREKRKALESQMQKKAFFENEMENILQAWGFDPKGKPLKSDIERVRAQKIKKLNELFESETKPLRKKLEKDYYDQEAQAEFGKKDWKYRRDLENIEEQFKKLFYPEKYMQQEVKQPEPKSQAEPKQVVTHLTEKEKILQAWGLPLDRKVSTQDILAEYKKRFQNLSRLSDEEYKAAYQKLQNEQKVLLR